MAENDGFKEVEKMITIDQERCIGCGACVADCFPEAIQLMDGKAAVVGRCIECGHCFAVCPTGAVDMGEEYPTKDVIEFADWPPEFDGDVLLAALESRRSIRRFKHGKVPQAMLERVLDAGRFTPTGSNAQNVRYVVVQDVLEMVKAQVWENFQAIIDGYVARMGKGRLYDTLTRMQARHMADPADDRLFFNAPALLIVCSPAPLNGGLAASSIALMAHVEGLGTLYSGFIQMALSQSPALCEALGVRPEEIVACLLIGVPDVTYERTAPRKALNVEWR